MDEHRIDVSIVIVCMNNLKNLYPCLESIKRYTTVSYECMVVAYLFSHKNLEKVKRDFSWANFIESNEIRGFSENNNLALRQAKGKYCFVVNDDTVMKMPVVDELVKTIKRMSDDVAVVSPNVLRPDGTIQHCGRPSINMWEDMLDAFRYIKRMEQKSKFCHKKGVFQTYNIHGAAFLIKTDVFRKYGFFDERYFFCPEDIALSTRLNEDGLKCMVNSDVVIIHIGGGTWSKTLVATRPATVRGNVIFFCDKFWKIAVYRCYWTLFYMLYYLYWLIAKNADKEKQHFMLRATFNGVVGLWSSKTPKQLFTYYYLQIKRNM